MRYISDIHQAKRHYGVRANRYKLIHFYYDIDEWELYGPKKDTEEMHNVYNDLVYSQVQKNMHKKLTKLRARYKDSDENNKWFIKYNNSQPLPDIVK